MSVDEPIHAPVKPRWHPSWRDVLSALIVLVVIGGGTTVIILQSLSIAQFQRSGAAKDATISSQQDDITKLRNQVFALGHKPVVAEPSPVPTPAPGVGVKGDKGDTGEQGPGPSSSQIAGAVQDYCAVHGGCMGPAGQTGAAGVNGTDGVDGAAGPAGPQGDPGPAGPAGANGSDGRGLTSLTCQDDGTWLVTYTDGTMSTTDGPCKVLP